VGFFTEYLHFRNKTLQPAVKISYKGAKDTKTEQRVEGSKQGAARMGQIKRRGA